MEETARERLKRLVREMKEALLSGDGELAADKEKEFYRALDGVFVANRYPYYTGDAPQQASKE